MLVVHGANFFFHSWGTWSKGFIYSLFICEVIASILDLSFLFNRLFLGVFLDIIIFFFSDGNILFCASIMLQVLY